jgi:hypothetical protein
VLKWENKIIWNAELRIQNKEFGEKQSNGVIIFERKAKLQNVLKPGSNVCKLWQSDVKQWGNSVQNIAFGGQKSEKIFRIS